MSARGAVALLSGFALAVPTGGQADLPAVAEVVNARVETVTYRGMRALHLLPIRETTGKDDRALGPRGDPGLLRAGTGQPERAAGRESAGRPRRVSGNRGTRLRR